MSLKILLKPGEYIYVGKTRIILVSDQTAALVVDGTLPVLRQTDHLPPEQATSPAERLYVLLQDVYLDGTPEKLASYHGEAKRLVEGSGEFATILEEVATWLSKDLPYKALKAAKPFLRRHSVANVR
jgi:flagellar biosynthesis repressor protein FlbT